MSRALLSKNVTGTKKMSQGKRTLNLRAIFFRNVLLKAIFLSGNHEKPLFFRFTKSRYYRRENPKKYDCFTKARLQWKQRIFFYFATWISWLFSHFWWCSRVFIAWNPWVVFIKLGKKMKPLGRSRSARTYAPALGPRRSPERFQFFFTKIHETTYGFKQ